MTLKDHFEKTALDIALNYSYTPLAALLLEYGAWPTEKQLQLALRAVAQRGSENLAKKLVKAGADPRKKDRDGRSTYHLAEEAGNDDTARTILQLCKKLGSE